ncbi:MAG: IS3 family transposase, partial [Terriglobales bacterium]
MKKSRFSEEQIVGVLKEAEAGVAMADLCRRLGISEGTFYRWKAKYGGLEVNEAKRLRQLEEENRQLKHLVAELTLDNRALKAVLFKKVVGPPAKREAVRVVREQAGVSERRACGLVQIHRASARYRQRRHNDQRLQQRLRELAAQRVRFGYRRLHVLLRREGWAVNHKRVYRLYREEGLAVRRRKRKRAAATERVPLVSPVRPNQGWSMDFMADALGTGRHFRTLNLVDEYTREALAIEVDTSLPGERVVRVLEQLRQQGRKPEWIVTDNGPEFTGQRLDQWAYGNGVRLETIRPGRPMENGYIESFNGKMREECLNVSWFTDLADARQRI